MVKIINFFLVLSVSYLIIFLFTSSSGGQDFAYAGHPSDSGICTACHFGGTTGGSITLTGAPTVYTPGQVYPMSLRINDSDALRGGFQIVAVKTTPVSNTQVGTFSTTINQTRLSTGIVGRLIQSTPKAFSGGQVTWNFNWTAPSTSPPSQVRFYYAGNAAAGSNSTDGDAIYSGTSAAIPLPIDLVDFNVIKNERGHNVLNWTTKSEVNADRFEIEKSLSGNEFERISDVNAFGNSVSTRNYSYTDYDTKYGNVFYRLKMIDVDGSYEYSNIVSLESKDKENKFQVIGKSLILNFTSKEKNTISILNSNGQRVANKSFSNSEESTIQLNHLPDGIYFIMINNKYEGKIPIF